MSEGGTDLCSARLLELARNGEDWALERLFQRYAEPLRRWARGRLPRWARSVVDTDDLVQDSLLGSLRNLGTFRADRAGAMHSYLRTAVRNRIKDELRKMAAHPGYEDLPTDKPGCGVSPLEDAIGRETLTTFETALERLPTQKREAIVARIELGLNYEEIAIAMDKNSADAARMMVKRAIASLATEMAMHRTPDTPRGCARDLQRDKPSS